MVLEEILTEQATDEEEHDDVDQVEATHGLQLDEVFKARAGGERDEDDCRAQAEGDEYAAEPVKGRQCGSRMNA